jgi:hypothetical protein
LVRRSGPPLLQFVGGYNHRTIFAFCLTRFVSVPLCAGTERGDRDDAPGAQGGGELHAVAANQEGCTPRFCCLLITPIFRVSLLTLCCV